MLNYDLENHLLGLRIRALKHNMRVRVLRLSRRWYFEFHGYGMECCYPTTKLHGVTT